MKMNAFLLSQMRRAVNIFCVAAFFAWLCVTTPAAAANGVVRHVANGKSFVLEDGRVVRLAAIQAPNVDDPKHGKGEPLGEEARRALASLVEGKKVTWTLAAASPDRKGRIVAFATDEKGRSVQAEMLRQGMAMVYTFPDTRQKAAALLAEERAARENRRGMWAHPYFTVIQGTQAQLHPGRFKLIEGTVRGVEERKSATYLNFGQDWKTDFTLKIARSDRRYFKGVDVKSWAGKRVRVRGWIYEKNGAMVDLTHPEQVELVP